MVSACQLRMAILLLCFIRSSVVVIVDVVVVIIVDICRRRRCHVQLGGYVPALCVGTKWGLTWAGSSLADRRADSVKGVCDSEMSRPQNKVLGEVQAQTNTPASTLSQRPVSSLLLVWDPRAE